MKIRLGYGFLLELLEIKIEETEQLRKNRTNACVLFEPSYPKIGKTLFKIGNFAKSKY